MNQDTLQPLLYLFFLLDASIQIFASANILLDMFVMFLPISDSISFDLFHNKCESSPKASLKLLVHHVSLGVSLEGCLGIAAAIALLFGRLTSASDVRWHGNVCKGARNKGFHLFKN